MRPEDFMDTQTQRPHRGRPMSCNELVEGLCIASLSLNEARRLHLESYGTLIPHIFMGDVLKRVGACFIAGSEHAIANDGDEVKGIFEALERGMAEGDREARNVIAISFVRDGEVELFFDDAFSHFGPIMRQQVQGK
jgi:hypothetical protein